MTAASIDVRCAAKAAISAPDIMTWLFGIERGEQTVDLASSHPVRPSFPADGRSTCALQQMTVERSSMADCGGISD